MLHYPAKHIQLFSNVHNLSMPEIFCEIVMYVVVFFVIFFSVTYHLYCISGQSLSVEYKKQLLLDLWFLWMSDYANIIMNCHCEYMYASHTYM